MLTKPVLCVLVAAFSVADLLQPSLASSTAAADCGPVAAAPVVLPIVVSMPPAQPFTVGAIDPASFRNPRVSDPSWQLHYRGFMYLMPLAARAAVDGNSTALATMVSQLVAFHRADPDPSANLYGWDEGTAQRRLQLEN